MIRQSVPGAATVAQSFEHMLVQRLDELLQNLQLLGGLNEPARCIAGGGIGALFVL